MQSKAGRFQLAFSICDGRTRSLVKVVTYGMLEAETGRRKSTLARAQYLLSSATNQHTSSVISLLLAQSLVADSSNFHRLTALASDGNKHLLSLITSWSEPSQSKVEEIYSRRL